MSALLSEMTGKKLKLLFYVEQNYAFDILRPIQNYAIKNGFQVKWLLVGSEVSSKYLQMEEERATSIEDAISYNADAVFAPGDRVPAFIPGMKVQVFHGLNESKRGNTYPERGLFDLYCTEGPERTGTLLNSVTNKDYFKVVETGWVKLDSLFQYQKKSSFSRPQILFASTFSPSLSCAELVYDEIKRLSQSSKWQWIVTLHPKMAKETVKKYKELENDNLVFFENNQVIEALHRADVMICDNSSVFQEFLLLNKPVITINNRQPLDCFINIFAPDMLESSLELALSPNEILLKNIRDYGPGVTPYLDGKSAPRVLTAVQNLLDQGWKDKKPKNLLRNLKMRNTLNYWKVTF